MSQAGKHFGWAGAAVVWGVLTLMAAAPAAAQKSGAAPYPPADRPWNSTDYRSLAQIVTAGQALPPTLTYPGPSFFERIVSPQNTALASAGQKDLSVELRMQEVLGTIAPVNALLKHYVNEAQKGRHYERELAKIAVYLLRLSSASIDLASEFMAKVPKDDKYEIRMAGLRQMQQGCRTTLAGLVQSVAETDFYSKASTLELAEGIIGQLPAFQPILTAEDRKDHAFRMEQQLAGTTDPEVKAALTSLRDAINRPGKPR